MADTVETQESVPSSGDLTLTPQELKLRLVMAMSRFRRACEQVSLINRKLQALEKRYFAARAVNRRSFRYVLRMRLMTTENVRDMYYNYAAAKADEVMALRKHLGGEWEEVDDDVAEFVDNDASDSEEDMDEDDASETSQNHGQSEQHSTTSEAS